MAHGGHVLVVDDEAPQRTLVRLNLEHQGYSVSEAVDADTGLGAAREAHPDLILLDIRMPKRDGWAMLTALRDDPALCHVPVVALTGDSDESSEWRARELGTIAYVTKPVDIDDLLRIVGEVMASRGIV